jgi:hypothetical protein
MRFVKARAFVAWRLVRQICLLKGGREGDDGTGADAIRVVPESWTLLSVAPASTGYPLVRYPKG